MYVAQSIFNSVAEARNCKSCQHSCATVRGPGGPSRKLITVDRASKLFRDIFIGIALFLVSLGFLARG